jgi:hypothetical protein
MKENYEAKASVKMVKQEAIKIYRESYYCRG